jgi:hypothetical protein
MSADHWTFASERESEALAQGQEPGGTGSAARGRGGVALSVDFESAISNSAGNNNVTVVAGQGQFLGTASQLI